MCALLSPERFDLYPAPVCCLASFHSLLPSVPQSRSKPALPINTHNFHASALTQPHIPTFNSNQIINNNRDVINQFDTDCRFVFFLRVREVLLCIDQVNVHHNLFLGWHYYYRRLVCCQSHISLGAETDCNLFLCLKQSELNAWGKWMHSWNNLYPSF